MKSFAFATCVALCCHQVPSLFPLTKDALEAFLAHMSALLHDADAQVSGLVTVSALASRVLHRAALLPCQGWVTSVLGEPLEAAVVPCAFNRLNILALVRTQGRPRKHPYTSDSTARFASGFLTRGGA